MKHVWKGHGADSENGNVSARQATLNRWTATDKRWKRKAISRGLLTTVLLKEKSDRNYNVLFSI